MIKITTDSTADLTKELYEQNQIDVIPLYVNYGDESYIDGETITPNDIIRIYNEKGTLPKTAARSPEEFKEFFEKCLVGHDALIHFSISSELSSMYNNALVASREFDNVYVIDTQVLSSGVGALALYACDLRNQGLTVNEMLDKINATIGNNQTSFVVDSMEFLHKGGRCSGLVKLAAGMLNIKPILNLINGKIEVCGKFMGRLEKKINVYTDSVFNKYPNAITDRIFVTHSPTSREVCDLVISLVKQRYPDANIIETDASCTVTSHCGEGTIGVLYLYHK